jgi:hypothetical protein
MGCSLLAGVGGPAVTSNGERHPPVCGLLAYRRDFPPDHADLTGDVERPANTRPPTAQTRKPISRARTTLNAVLATRPREASGDRGTPGPPATGLGRAMAPLPDRCRERGTRQATRATGGNSQPIHSTPPTQHSFIAVLKLFIHPAHEVLGRIRQLQRWTATTGRRLRRRCDPISARVLLDSAGFVVIAAVVWCSPLRETHRVCSRPRAT